MGQTIERFWILFGRTAMGKDDPLGPLAQGPYLAFQRLENITAIPGQTDGANIQVPEESSEQAGVKLAAYEHGSLLQPTHETWHIPRRAVYRYRTAAESLPEVETTTKSDRQQLAGDGQQ